MSPAKDAADEPSDDQDGDGEIRMITDAKADARTTELAKQAYVRAEVDRAGLEELPKLGGDIADTWAPDATDEG